jgi:hypothetical protein
MSNDSMQPVQDDIDQLMSSAFDRAMEPIGQIDLVNVVMGRIRRRQRLRFLVMSLVGIIAIATCVINGLPLATMLWTSMTSSAPGDWAAAAPGLLSPTLVMGLIALLGVGCVQLLLEDAV